MKVEELKSHFLLLFKRRIAAICSTVSVAIDGIALACWKKDLFANAFVKIMDVEQESAGSVHLGGILPAVICRIRERKTYTQL